MVLSPGILCAPNAILLEREPQIGRVVRLMGLDKPLHSRLNQEPRYMLKSQDRE